jgi:hypothetical protein
MVSMSYITVNERDRFTVNLIDSDSSCSNLLAAEGDGWPLKFMNGSAL